MKVIAINGSPREQGNTYSALNIMAEVLEREGIETEIFQIGAGPIRACTACGACKRIGRCVHSDSVNQCADKLQEANGVILGAPTYCGGIAGGAKCFYDRLFHSGHAVRGKVGAAVSVARRSGGESVYHQLSSYLTLGGAVIAPTTYWNVIHGRNPGEVLQDEEGVTVLRTVGATMAWLIKSLDMAQDTVPMPVIEKNIATDFIR